MARKNIFEKLQSRWDMDYEASCLWRLITSECAFNYYGRNFTIMEYASFYCFSEWKNRGHFLKLSDFLEEVSYNSTYVDAHHDPEAFLDFIEISYNLYYMAHQLYEQSDSDWTHYEAYELFPKIANDCLAHFNHRVFYDEDVEQAIVIEADPAVTAVIEIEDDLDIAFEIARYNHHTLKGDIVAKKAILIKLGSQLEPLRPTLAERHRNLAADIFTLLNNLNIRHNNCVPGDTKYKPYVAAMTTDELEDWYDELYQMILLAKLELDHIDRIPKIEALKQKI